MKILLVDENDMNRDMLSRRLLRRGYDVITAIDGASALSLASTQEPEVVLMDMSMPVMDGWETTRRMKADAGTATIRIIALTAHAMAADRERALAAGCDDFDTKPVDLDRLIAKIDAVTAGRSA